MSNGSCVQPTIEQILISAPLHTWPYFTRFITYMNTVYNHFLININIFWWISIYWFYNDVIKHFSWSLPPQQHISSIIFFFFGRFWRVSYHYLDKYRSIALQTKYEEYFLKIQYLIVRNWREHLRYFTSNWKLKWNGWFLRIETTKK